MRSGLQCTAALGGTTPDSYVISALPFRQRNIISSFNQHTRVNAMNISRSVLPALLAAALLSSSCNTPKADGTARRDAEGTGQPEAPATKVVNNAPAPNSTGVEVVKVAKVEGQLTPGASLVGQMAPNFTWTSADGKERSLKDYRGKVVLLNFWGTWCPPCRAELPDIVRLRKELQPKGFEVIGLGVNEEARSGGSSPEENVAKFAQKNGLLYPLLLVDGNLIEAYGGLEGVPTTFIVNKKGEIVEMMVGMRDEATFRRSIEKAMS